MALSAGRGKDFKSDSGPLGVQAQPGAWEPPLPKDIVENVLYEVLDEKARIEFARTQQCSAKNSKYHLFSKFQNERFSLCLSNILKGNYNAVKSYLESLSAQPELLKHFLTTVSQARDWRGQLFEGTAYQMALAAEDTQMAELIKQHLVAVAGEEEANVQYHTQFPMGWEQAEEKRWEGVFEQLEILALAVKNADLKAGDITAPNRDAAAKESSPVKQALDEFWRRLDAVSTEVIRTGRAFNPQLLERALQIYDEHYEDYFGNSYNNPRALLFVQKVIGREGIQGVMPANYVQAFRDGLTPTAHNLAKGIPQKRDSQFDIYRDGAWLLVDFLSSRARDVPDFNFCLCCRAGAGVVRCRHVMAFRILCDSKTAGLQNLCGNSQTVSLNR